MKKAKGCYVLGVIFLIFNSEYCSGLNYSVPSHKFRYLNTWSPGDEFVWRQLGGMALTKEIYRVSWKWVGFES